MTTHDLLGLYAAEVAEHAEHAESWVQMYLDPLKNPVEIASHWTIEMMGGFLGIHGLQKLIKRTFKVIPRTARRLLHRIRRH